MMKSRLKIVFLIASLMLSGLEVGCAVQQGNTRIADEDNTSLSTKLKPGVTTEDDVRGLFGDPSNTVLRDSGETEWDYEMQTGNIFKAAVGANNSVIDKKITMLFDSKGKLIRYALSGS
jgi:outer membrane protein assembly factor BamE (lipoprotein component of BamABCDE complex)